MRLPQWPWISMVMTAYTRMQASLLQAISPVVINSWQYGMQRKSPWMLLVRDWMFAWHSMAVMGVWSHVPALYLTTELRGFQCLTLEWWIASNEHCWTWVCLAIFSQQSSTLIFLSIPLDRSFASVQLEPPTYVEELACALKCITCESFLRNRSKTGRRRMDPVFSRFANVMSLRQVYVKVQGRYVCGWPILLLYICAPVLFGSFILRWIFGSHN